MSAKAFSAVTEAKGLSITERAVLWRMADQADDSGYSWLGIDTIADDLETTRRTVQRAINGTKRPLVPGLVEREYLLLVYRGGGHGRPSLYRVMPKVLQDDPSRQRSRLAYERSFRKGRHIVTLYGGGPAGTPSDQGRHRVAEPVSDEGRQDVTPPGRVTATPVSDTVTNATKNGDTGVTRHSYDTQDTRIERLDGESWDDALRRNAAEDLVGDPA